MSFDPVIHLEEHVSLQLKIYRHNHPFIDFIYIRLKFKWICYEFESCSGEVYSIQNYVIKLVCDLRQVGGFLWFPPNKTDCHDITEILLKVALNTKNLTVTHYKIYEWQQKVNIKIIILLN